MLAASSATGVGIERLGRTIFTQRVPERDAAHRADGEPADDRRARGVPARSTATATGSSASGDHLFRIAGPAVERLVGRHDLENRDALEYIEAAAADDGRRHASSRRRDSCPGDEIEIGEVAFALYPECRSRSSSVRVRQVTRHVQDLMSS